MELEEGKTRDADATCGPAAIEKREAVIEWVARALWECEDTVELYRPLATRIVDYILNGQTSEQGDLQNAPVQEKNHTSPPPPGEDSPASRCDGACAAVEI